MTKELKEKAIDVKGKLYVLVSDRVLYFNEKYPNGSIKTEKLVAEDRVEIKAIVTPDTDKPERVFTGHSQAVWGEGYINKTAALENAETSAVGRALAFMGIGVIESIASADEVKKAEGKIEPPQQKHLSKTPPSAKQKELIKSLMEQKGITADDVHDMGFGSFTDLTGGKSGTASELISQLLKEKPRVVNNQPVGEVEDVPDFN